MTRNDPNRAPENAGAIYQTQLIQIYEGISDELETADEVLIDHLNWALESMYDLALEILCDLAESHPGETQMTTSPTFVAKFADGTTTR